MTIENKGCPCGTQGKCCDNTQAYTPEHVCIEDEVCEDCYVQTCESCGASCYCDL